MLMHKQRIRLTSTKTETKAGTKLHSHGLDLKNLRPSKEQKSLKRQENQTNYQAAILFAGMPILAFCLGVWQIRRREWKLELIKMLEERTGSAPIPLPKDLNELKKSEYEYRAFKVKGRFDHARETLVTTRTDITETVKGPGGFLITPFKLSDRDVTILVNRGFLHHTNYSIEKRKEAQIEDEIELTGLLRHSEKNGLFTPNNKPHKNEWHSRDVELMALCLDTAPIFLDATEESTIKTKRQHPIGPIGGQTVINLRNEHVTYIATWFSLSAITSFMWYKNFAKHLFRV